MLVALSLALSLTTPIQQAVAVQSVQSVQANANTISARNRLLDVNFVDLPLDKALDSISQKSGVSVSYRRDQVLSVKPVTVHARGITANEAFSRVLAGTPYQLQPSGEQLYLISKKPGKSLVSQGVITGKVVDGKNSKPIAGATISLENGANGVTSGEDGAYRLTGVSVGVHTISVRLVGYARQTRSITVGEGATVTADFKLEPSANVLDQVVVTGTVVATELKAVPSAIAVVTAKQIEERGITHIDQLFRGDIPGLFVLNVGASNMDQVVMYARGATQLDKSSGSTPSTNPIKTYIDGVEMMNPSYLNQIDPKSIDRIEILTGPQASTIYGSNAINGVMQIFTKRGTSSRPQINASLLSGFLENNFSSSLAPQHDYSAQLTGMEGHLSYTGGATWRYLGAWTPARRNTQFGGYGSGRAQYHTLSLDASMRRSISQNRDGGAYSQGTTAKGTSGEWLYFNSRSSPVASVIGGQTLSTTVGYSPMSWWSHELVVGSDAVSTESLVYTPAYTYEGDTLLFANQSTMRRSSQRYTTTAQGEITSVLGAILTIGMDHWRTQSSSQRAGGVALTGTLPFNPSITRDRPGKNTGGFVQGQLNIGEALFFTYGLRAEWNPNYGDDVQPNMAPRFGIAYTREIGAVTSKLRAAYGRSTRPPTQDQKAALASTSPTLIAVYGPYDARVANLELGPEFQQGGEGGLELYIANRASFVITHYNQTVNDLILSPTADSVRSLAPNPSFFNSKDTSGFGYWYQTKNMNLGSVRNQGWELQGSVNTGPFTTRGTYSWTKSRVIGVTPAYRKMFATAFNASLLWPGASFTQFPEHTWMMQTTYGAGRTMISVNVNGMGATYRQSNELTGSINRIRLRTELLRMDRPQWYFPMAPGYVTADMNASHRFSPRFEGVLQVQNLTNSYQIDNGQSIFAALGRQTKAGVRVQM